MRFCLGYGQKTALWSKSKLEAIQRWSAICRVWPWTLTYQKFLLCISSQGRDLYSHQKLNTYVYLFSSKSGYNSGCHSTTSRATYCQQVRVQSNLKKGHIISGIWCIKYTWIATAHTYNSLDLVYTLSPLSAMNALSALIHCRHWTVTAVRHWLHFVVDDSRAKIEQVQFHRAKGAMLICPTTKLGKTSLPMSDLDL